MYECMSLCTRVRMYVCMYVCTCVRMYACVGMHVCTRALLYEMPAYCTHVPVACARASLWLRVSTDAKHI